MHTLVECGPVEGSGPGGQGEAVGVKEQRGGKVPGLAAAVVVHITHHADADAVGR